MRRIGVLMMVVGWLLLAGLIWWVLDGQLERRNNPNAHLATVAAGTQREVVLQRGRDGHYRAPGRINGHPVNFLVDTGATQVAIPQELARAIGLRAGRAFQAQTANGLSLAYTTRLDSVSLGSLQARDVAGTIMANDGVVEGADEVLLGMSFLSRFDIAISNEEMRLRAR
ncbi:MAG: TIGR02281 family clan AA aspartic protease [Hydrogenophilales bacterium CG_4_9_14_3_um_filter_63_34]|nr:MAG: TIGR02281 family clan AA aspartic protease [Hydrogenophilales bacterium CG_4_10_14_3_um_filter_63_21]PJB02681.1 MAG: TIGR02281 family clan AA aspartic protease [Hydrogenophilales bacterium CG_4_9_14_3_um_filter_63_34]